jgi:EAL domain-containing protein (putative c-di-GMP-specific phosphodiesterase class I)
LQSGKITGFEALTRWQRPEGLVSPLEFIPVAEETGLIIPMNRLLLREACQDLQAWQAEFRADPPLTMSINITPREFAQPDLAYEIGRTLEQLNFDPDCLRVEIVETIAMGDEEKSGLALAQLKALGVHLSIDDFGTGYSSLSRLRRIPVDTLKIDRTFISNMDTDPDNLEIVKTIIMLAHNLGLKVVAEGPETQVHIDQLKLLKCEMAQGYFYSRPADNLTMVKLLSANQSAAAATAGR